MSEVVNLYKGDCLTEHERIESGSVDLILCDPPYGTMKGINDNFVGYGRRNHDGHSWDMAINPADFFDIANRMLRRNGKLVLFSQEPYTSRLITEAIPNLPFNYRMVWEKDTFANALLVNKAPVSYYEDILVFSKAHESHNTHPIASIVKSLQEDSGHFWNDSIAKYYVSEGYSKSFGNAKAVLKHYLNWDYVQFSVVTKRHYDILSNFFDWGYSHEELITIDEDFKKRSPSVFNLWEGGKYKSNILRYKKDYDGYHPTQKPVALLDDLIRTYSNEGAHVVDLTMGSGSTGVAAVKAGRRFTGIELGDEYFGIAERRISESLT